MKKNFLLLIWALALSGVLFAQSAVYVDGFNGESPKGNTSIPEIELSDVLSEYTTSQDIVVTALIQSNGLIDQLCAVEYELYKDDVLIVNIADYGTLAYKIRQEGNTYHEEQLTQGSGTISITVAEESLSAFTLGLFDNFCINRNRPVELTANFTVPGVYRMVTKINSCSNFGIPTGSTFTATNCDGAVHIDKVGETCENPTELSSQEVTIIVNEPPTPEIEFSEILPEYIIGSDVEVTASVYSNGLIDQLCGIGYEIYKDDVLITNIADYGTLTYDVRQEGDTYYNGILTDGSGMIEVVVAEDNIGAFTLGIFDNYCVNRNRPVDFTANFTAPGVYKMVTSIYSCSNTGIAAGTSFTATNCDGEIHADMIGATCQNPTELSSEELIITVVEPPTPEIEFSEILPEYIIGSDVEVTASVYSNGLIDQLCGIGYEIYKDDVLITNIADYGTLTYDVRQEGDTYYNGVLTDGSGMIEVVVAEDNIGAFTLGIFDNYCVNRNRPVDFTANFTAPGVYKMVTSIYSCSNTGIAAGTSFTASNCDGELHADVIGATCQNPTELSSEEVIITVVEPIAPEIEFSEILPEYIIGSDVEVTASVYSNGLIDQLCGIGYEIYKDDVLITNIADYGTLTYDVRQEGDTYYNGILTDGSGMIEVVVAEDNIGAFTLGIFDNYCVNRNRPVDFTANFTAPGVYKMVTSIYSCSNTGIAAGTSFTASNCDGEIHADMIGETCENPTELSSEELIITVIELVDPVFSFNTEYCLNAVAEELPLISDNDITGTWSPATIATDAAGNVDYIFIADAGQNANEMSVTVTVNALQEVNCPADFTVTEQGVVTLSGATPAGGTYSGTGVTAENFDPSSLDNGAYTITYEYTDATTGCSDFCEFIITVDITSSIAENKIATIGVYPNPNNGMFTINFANVNGKTNYQIYDTKGSIILDKIIYTNGVTIEEVSLNLESGIYFIKVLTQNQIIVEKLVIK